MAKLEGPALDLFAQVISANVAASQAATDRVIEDEHRQAVDMARAFIKLYYAADKAAEVVTTRQLELALDYAQVSLRTAHQLIDREDF